MDDGELVAGGGGVTRISPAVVDADHEGLLDVVVTEGLLAGVVTEGLLAAVVTEEFLAAVVTEGLLAVVVIDD